ncbi:MAG: hypothetical protein K8S94_04005 [Planctomycetia bacterium]|nr:hypothetical protein [Planctomycetia bacterium]
MLQRPLLTPIVVGFWLVTSGWLVVAKILPTLNPGSPPGQQALYTAGNRPIPVAWTVFLNERPVGWALATSNRAAEGSLAVKTHLHVENLPLDEMLPAWVSRLVQRAHPVGTTVGFDARGTLAIDSLGTLRSFSSRVNLPGTAEEVKLDGTVDDGKVVVTIEAGGMQYEANRHLPSHVMIGDEFSPQATLPGLSEGRCWTVPVYSPLRPSHAPIEILHAEVGSEETLYWENALVRVHVVSYREDPTSDREPRCRMWVDLSGRVLKQEAAIIGAQMLFVRRTDEAAALLAEETAAASAPPADDTLTTETGAS